jgi:hypothetical protein
MNLRHARSNVALFALALLGLVAVEPARAQFAPVDAPTAAGISIGPGGDMFLLGADQTPAGSVLYRWDGRDWRRFPGAAVRLAVDSNGDPWAVTTDNHILRYSEGQWATMPGRATDIATGADGSVWITGNRLGRRGYQVFRWDGRGWAPTGREAISLAVDPRGNPWVIDATQSIFRFDGRDWHTLPGTGTEISIGANGDVWLLGTDVGPFGHGIYHWNGRSWDASGGMAVSLAVAPDGSPWVVNNGGYVFQYSP